MVAILCQDDRGLGQVQPFPMIRPPPVPLPLGASVSSSDKRGEQNYTIYHTASEGRQNISRAARGDVSRFLCSEPQFLQSVKWGGCPAGCQRGPSTAGRSSEPSGPQRPSSLPSLWSQPHRACRPRPRPRPGMRDTAECGNSQSIVWTLPPPKAPSAWRGFSQSLS